ncbi:uncharacterized protein N0V96_010332 [Colletotrichum fioriniae]|uniref:uncharacterized protein n=1 Tax=Colletotrichum fioriniae TaxID=710243 RepID=UPI0032DA9D45|nr:hypothetical protein N0V96_010332 [Colletotrichum fioriniae]
MARTRTGRGAPESPEHNVQDARSARLTRRRAGGANMTERIETTDRTTASATASAASRSTTRGRGRDKVAPTSTTLREMAEEREEREEDVEKREEKDLYRNEPVARFNAKEIVRDINPQDNDSEAPGSSAPRASQGRVQLPGIEDDGSDDESEKSEGEDDASQDLIEAELKENALDSLWHESEALARLLRNPKPGSKSWRRLLPVFQGNWFRIREFFVETDALFIDLLASIEDISERQQMKARAVIIGANATSLLNVISDAELRKEDNFDRVWKIFERLDEDFPAPLCPYDDYADHVTEDDIELALDIRTQRLITTLKALPDDQQNPADIAAELFCMPLEASVDAEEALQYGPFRGINGRMAERFAERAKHIYDAIADKNVDDAIQVLDEMFPLEGSPDQSQSEADEPTDFISKISAWCSKMIDELSAILKDPPQGPRESSPTDSLPSSAPQDIVRNDVREDILSRSNVQLLAKLSRENPSRTRPSPSLANSQRGSQRGATDEPIINGGIGDDYYDEEAEDRRRNPSPAPSDLSAIIAGLPSTAIIRSTQPPSSSAKAGPPRSSDFTAVNSNSRKRPREASLSYSQQSQESDDPFEEDNRDPNPPTKSPTRPRPPRHAPPLETQNPPLPRHHHHDSPLHPPHHHQQQRPPSNDAPCSSLPTGAPASSAASAPPTSSRSSVSSTATTVASFREINEMNRRPASRAGPQQRVPWSNRDTHRLIRLIEHHNCLWALIAKRQVAAAGRGGGYGDSFEEREDCVFDHPRDQQAIRDKARNLKVDLLKADLNLYPGFDGIALGKKERLALISRGKNPDRREGDVDAAGEPTHTEYVPLESDDEDDEL